VEVAKLTKLVLSCHAFGFKEYSVKAPETLDRKETDMLGGVEGGWSTQADCWDIRHEFRKTATFPDIQPKQTEVLWGRTTLPPNQHK
jgi:hypothetical protein